MADGSENEVAHDSPDSLAPYPGSKRVPRWNLSALPSAPRFTVKSWLGLLGPGLMMGAFAIGGGEWLMGPIITAKFGGGLLWLALLAVLSQLRQLGLCHVHQSVDLILRPLKVLNAEGVYGNTFDANLVAYFEDLLNCQPSRYMSYMGRNVPLPTPRNPGYDPPRPQSYGSSRTVYFHPSQRLHVVVLVPAV